MKSPASASASSTVTSNCVRLPTAASSNPRAPAPPKKLSREAKKWWREIQAEFSIEDQAGLLLLQTAMEALDRLREAQRVIKEEGPVVLDRFEQQKPHPLLTTERDSRSAMLASLKALNLDLEPLRDVPGRPSGGLGR